MSTHPVWLGVQKMILHVEKLLDQVAEQPHRARAKEVVPMSSRIYPATVVRVVDGDSVIVDLDLGFWMVARLSCRLAGCNTRETNEPGGSEARTFLTELLPAGTKTTVRSVGVDKYAGRFDGYIRLLDGRDATDVMIEEGLAAPWNGKGPRPLPPWPRPEESP